MNLAHESHSLLVMQLVLRIELENVHLIDDSRLKKEDTSFKELDIQIDNSVVVAPMAGIRTLLSVSL